MCVCVCVCVCVHTLFTYIHTYRLFERNADIKKAFSQFRMLDTDNDMRSNASLESHALLVMNTIDEAVNLLDGDNATIKRLLYKAGKTHRRFPILQRNFFAVIRFFF